VCIVLIGLGGTMLLRSWTKEPDPSRASLG